MTRKRAVTKPRISTGADGKTGANLPTRDDTLTTRKAAELLGVSVRTVQLWVESGVLVAWKTPGGHRRVARDSVMQLKRVPQDPAPEPETLDPSDIFTVLIVEDNANMRRLYELTMGGWNLPIKVRVCENGFEGLIEVGRLLPKVLITDLNMPNMDGFAMLRWLAQGANTELLVVSGLTDAKIRARGGLPEGFTRFTKPVPFTDLRSSIEAKIGALATAD